MMLVCYYCVTCQLHVHVGEYEDDDPTIRICTVDEDKTHAYGPCPGPLDELSDREDWS